MLRFLPLVLTIAPLAADAIIDDFNRPDANTLGPNWTVVDGGAQIVGNRAAGLANASLVVYDGLSASGSFMDVYNTGPGLQYAALVLGYSSDNQDYFIKVQNQSGGNSFGTYAFYYGNNDSTGAISEP